MQTIILWFRRDLRLYDNPAFRWVTEKLCHQPAGLQGGSNAAEITGMNRTRLIALYIHDDTDSEWAPGGATRWWLHHSLASLQSDLKSRDIDLQFMTGTPEQVFGKLVTDLAARHNDDSISLVYNSVYEPDELALEARLDEQLGKQVEIKVFHSSVLFLPGSVLNNQGKPYRVYTPFMKSVRPSLDALLERDYWVEPAACSNFDNADIEGAVELDKVGLLDQHPWHEKLHKHWQPGESHCHKLVESFMDCNADNYGKGRDFPAMQVTSRLSPALHFGEVSPRMVMARALMQRQEVANGEALTSVETFIKQILWREFAIHVLFHFPHTLNQPMDQRFVNEFWIKDDVALKQWQQGKTGIPIVDAGMQQLWQTGWMHNRVRMIVASYLTKNLGVHWLEGARWFWDTLVDADLANNSMGWQWVAGCGVDAAPYYRVFNPVTQAEKFDRQAQYISSWTDTDYSVDSDIIEFLRCSREQALARYKQTVSGK